MIWDEHQNIKQEQEQQEKGHSDTLGTVLYMYILISSCLLLLLTTRTFTRYIIVCYNDHLEEKKSKGMGRNPAGTVSVTSREPIQPTHSKRMDQINHPS